MDKFVSYLKQFDKGIPTIGAVFMAQIGLMLFHSSVNKRYSWLHLAYVAMLWIAGIFYYSSLKKLDSTAVVIIAMVVIMASLSLYFYYSSIDPEERSNMFYVLIALYIIVFIAVIVSRNKFLKR